MSNHCASRRPHLATFAANYLAELLLALAVIFALAAVGLVCYLAGRGAAVVLVMLFMLAVVEIVWRMARRRAAQSCPCSLRERDSGHRVGCYAPQAIALIAKIEPRP